MVTPPKKKNKINEKSNKERKLLALTPYNQQSRNKTETKNSYVF